MPALANRVLHYQNLKEKPPLELSKRARRRELERENHEPKMNAEFLSKAAAHFAAEER